MAKDPQLAQLLQNLRVSPTFYGFRWITLLMTQEWDLPDVLRLWDSLLSDGERFQFLQHVAATMVISMREPFLEHKDFAFCVKKLQHFENYLPVHALVARAAELYFDDYPALRPEPTLRPEPPVRTASATPSSSAPSASASAGDGPRGAAA